MFSGCCVETISMRQGATLLLRPSHRSIQAILSGSVNGDNTSILRRLDLLYDDCPTSKRAYQVIPLMRAQEGRIPWAQGATLTFFYSLSNQQIT